MIIDFHTHIFPDKIAEKTISILSAKGGDIPAFSDGTESGLIKKMEEANVDVAISMPVLTKPTQFETVTAYAAQINQKYKDKERRIISFAGIHPDTEKVDEHMKRIKEEGFLGIKLHPDYQATYIDDERYIRIVECARDYDLIVLTHAGADVAYKGYDVACPPDRALKLIRRVPYSKLVFAHLGGIDSAEKVLDMLAGEDVYFDTSYCLREVPRDLFMRYIDKHGADRILFGSDSPWSNMAEDVKTLKSFSLERCIEEKIFSGNARELLGI